MVMFIPIIGIPLGLMTLIAAAAMMFVNLPVGVALLFVALL